MGNLEIKGYSSGKSFRSFVDAQANTWIVDLSFMTSSYGCIYGKGCKSTTSESQNKTDVAATEKRQPGCCTWGAEFWSKQDYQRTAKAIKRLPDKLWQRNHLRKSRKWAREDDSGPDGASAHPSWPHGTDFEPGGCVFHNDMDFDFPGCALWHLAQSEGVSPTETRPAICWQMPLRINVVVNDDDFTYTFIVTEFGRQDWGGGKFGGHSFHWWCTEDINAFDAPDPIFESMDDELHKMVLMTCTEGYGYDDESAEEVYRAIKEVCGSAVGLDHLPLDGIVPHPTVAADIASVPVQIVRKN